MGLPLRTLRPISRLAVKQAAVCAVACLAAACARAPTAPSMPPGPSPTNTPTELAPTTPSPTSASPASPTRPPDPTVAYYHLRIELSTTSDWTTLQVVNLEHLLTARLISVSGDPEGYSVGLDMLSLGQPLAVAEAGHSIALTVDYALDPRGITEPLRLLLQKGALHGSFVRVLYLVGTKPVLLQETFHRGVVDSDPGRNPLSFSIDLRPLADLAPREVPAAAAPRPRMVWAFYYPWYTLENWASIPLLDTPTTLYRSDDPEVIARHIQQAQGAGIDGFISSWWGPGHYTDRNLRLLLDLAEASGFWVTTYFETLTDTGPRTPHEIERFLAYLIQNYRHHPAYMHLDDRPVIVVWASATVPLATWQEIFSRLEAQGLEAAYLAMGYDLAALEVFDGLHDYGIFTYPDLAATYAETGRAVRAYSLLLDPPEPRLWVATVQPGYDDTTNPRRQGLVQLRLDGAFYRATWEAAVASRPDWIFITTWNEWWEHTHIEPSQAYGDLYLDITRDQALAWKGP